MPLYRRLTLCSPSAHPLLTLCSPSAHPLLTLCSTFAHPLFAIKVPRRNRKNMTNAQNISNPSFWLLFFFSSSEAHVRPSLPDSKYDTTYLSDFG